MTDPTTPEELLPALKTELGDAADGVSDENLLKFLRWKPSVERAAGRFRDHQSGGPKTPSHSKTGLSKPARMTS